MSLHVLLVEDDRELRRILQRALSDHGHQVTVSASAADASAVIRSQRQGVDLVLLDLGLPDADGADWLKEMRAHHQMPILVISARSDERQKVHLLDLGADDYLVKPFSIQELLARMRVAWRHRGMSVQAPLMSYQNSDLEIDLHRHCVRRAGQAIHLTPTEFKLLARLVRQAGQVVTHRQLLMDVWGPEHTEQLQYLRLYMAQLRTKLEDRPAQPLWLQTEPGVGYRLAEPSVD